MIINLKKTLLSIFLLLLTQSSIKAGDLNKRLFDAVGFNANLNEVKSLLAQGADVNAREASKSGNSPLMVAIYNSSMFTQKQPLYMAIIELLLKNGARTDYRNNKGQTAFDYVRTSGNPELINLVNSYL